LEIWGNVQVWRQAATQVFFALGLGYGSVIAYSSYNPFHNNCHRDALMVSCINFMTSVLASLVVFVVLGFRAKTIALHCVAENLGVLTLMSSNGSSQYWWPSFNFTDPSSVSLPEYRQWYDEYGSMLGPQFTDCNLEEEMNKGVEGTGLAFIAFTEVMALFPASPFWSTLFFLMLLNLGLSTMFGTMQGILTPLMDNFKLLGRHRTLLTAFRVHVVEHQASEMTLEYPGWALTMIVMLIVFASLPVPIGYIHSLLKNRNALAVPSQESPGPEVHRELYTKCNSTDQLDSNSHPAPCEDDGVHPRTSFLLVGNEQYRLLPQQEEEGEEEEEEKDTGV
ncbi:hypothetical protein CRENBAI_011938, partial [Crenichthys baileyi]